MKSNVVKLTEESLFNEQILQEVEKCAGYNNLDKKSALRLTLLAEEMIGMLPNLATGYDASFWVETSGNEYLLRAELSAPVLTAREMEDAIALSSSGKNAAATGLIGKIRHVINLMSASMADSQVNVIHPFLPSGMDGMATDFDASLYSAAWTLDEYRKSASDKKEDWDELEKSVVAKLADNVIVGVKGRTISITVCKKF